MPTSRTCCDKYARNWEKKKEKKKIFYQKLRREYGELKTGYKKVILVNKIKMNKFEELNN
jgi:hypothetical protein